MGEATGSLDACLCKGQAYYVDIERAQWPKQACQGSVCRGYKASRSLVSDDLSGAGATERQNNTPVKDSHHF